MTTELPVEPWITAQSAAERALCSTASIYRAAKSGQLRAARVGGRRALRFKPSWVDAWLEETATPIETSAWPSRAVLVRGGG